MLDLATELDHLAKAERHLAEGRARIARQADLVERLRRTGHDTGDSEQLLASLKGVLRSWEDHRDEVRATVARLRSGQLT